MQSRSWLHNHKHRLFDSLLTAIPNQQNVLTSLLVCQPKNRIYTTISVRAAFQTSISERSTSKQASQERFGQRALFGVLDTGNYASWGSAERRTGRLALVLGVPGNTQITPSPPISKPLRGLPCCPAVKNLPSNAADPGLIPRWGS